MKANNVLKKIKNQPKKATLFFASKIVGNNHTSLTGLHWFKAVVIVVSLVSTINIKAQGNALNFNGTNDNVTLSYNAAMDFSLTSKFTIEAWFKTLNTTAVLYSNHVDVSPFVGHEVAIVNNKLVFDLTNNYLNNAIRIETINSFNDGNWHHFACVYKGIPNAANIDIYVDGILQLQNVTINNLTGSPNTGNAPHIGCRNNTTYFLTGTVDELRVWGKALCSTEITARRNCELVGNEPNLLAYYNFNQGIAGGSNPTVTSLPDISGNAITGTLTTFALNGLTSNWIASTASVSGTCNYTLPVTVSGNTLMCIGSSNVLTANGATSYTWSTASNNTTISVSPTITTSYSVTGTNTITGCYNTASLTQSVAPLPTITVNSGSICAGSSFTMVPSGAITYTYSNGSAIASPTANANYTVTGTNSLGCTGNAAISAVTVNALPTVTVSSSTSGTICAGQSVSLTANGAATYSWNTGGSAAVIVASPSVTTSYTVTGTAASGCKNTAIITQSVSGCVGIQTIANPSSAVSVYPNPSTGIFMVELANGLTKVINVTDITGRIILTTTSSLDLVTVNITTLSNGIYYIKVISDNKAEVAKVVKH